jgi:hypothetical protein
MYLSSSRKERKISSEENKTKKSPQLHGADEDGLLLRWPRPMVLRNATHKSVSQYTLRQQTCPIKSRRLDSLLQKVSLLLRWLSNKTSDHREART